MSRAQGDGFKTWTDLGLNNYLYRLRLKLIKLREHKEAWYKSGEGWIFTEQDNILWNPNGSKKWHGWENKGKECRIVVFPKNSVKVEDGTPRAIGLAQYVFSFRDWEDWHTEGKPEGWAQAEANKKFKECIELAKNLGPDWVDPEYLEADEDGRWAFDHPFEAALGYTKETAPTSNPS